MRDRRKTHAMTMELKSLCGQRRGNRMSIITGPRDALYWSIVTCKRCLRMRYLPRR
jgi:hypothetical protein